MAIYHIMNSWESRNCHPAVESIDQTVARVSRRKMIFLMSAHYNFCKFYMMIDKKLILLVFSKLSLIEEDR
jgi:hypothetical protein